MVPPGRKHPTGTPVGSDLAHAEIIVETEAVGDSSERAVGVWC